MTNKEKKTIVALARRNKACYDIIASKVLRQDGSGKPISPYTAKHILTDVNGRTSRKRSDGNYHPETVKAVWYEASKLAREEQERISKLNLPQE